MISCMPNGVVINAEYIPVGALLRVRPITSGDRENQKDIQKPVGARPPYFCARPLMGNQPTLRIINRPAPAARPTRRRGKTLTTTGCGINPYPAPILSKIKQEEYMFETVVDVIRAQNAVAVYAHSTPSGGQKVETFSLIAAPYEEGAIQDTLEGMITMHCSVYHPARIVMSQTVEKLIYPAQKRYLQTLPVTLVVKSDLNFSVFRRENHILCWSPNVTINLEGVSNANL